MIIGIDANEANLTRFRVGVNQYAFDLLHAFYRLPSSHRFVIYLKTQVLDDLPPARRNWEYRIIPFPKLWTQTRLPWDLYTHRPQPDVFFSLTHYAPRFSPVPTVVAVMDLGFLKFPDQFTPKDYNQLKNWTAYSARQAAAVITISRHSKKDIISAYGIDPAKIFVTYPGYDRQLFRPVKNASVLKKYGVNPPYFLFLGSLRPSKNIEGLINAFHHLEPKTYNLVIAGKKGWMYERIFTTVGQLALENRVIFTGFVDEAEVPALMTGATAFVMPSFYEGFGIPVVEAMACGTPVVVSKVASLPEVAGPAGIYIDPSSPGSIAAGLLTAAGPYRREFVKKGLDRVKLFNWAKTARQTLQILESTAKL
ncbi:MAG: Glycosyl transferase group 1 [Candidatus Amesbacteria bacterium GW2011_GWB1_47_19]|nr:MAG: Glycosyl transferase group 1 [Candidatus Amesbacteria bacterium GW2011_GWA1_44_24]KKU31746.1 MAG: group 1 glycosyl transferase [Candidatus Amesbacteria bacterium GW2011_GWC1_46_24]KKU67659.1 MAG: Glycosyl transferase group 1 [Candidatus Amesbacteria bacterium GW2011_GWB1_47_19]HBC72912.1 glycosyltransferase family 1 protein [Candidatus Amesbacteria bacterium]